MKQDISDQIIALISKYLSTINSKTLLEMALKRRNLTRYQINTSGVNESLINEIVAGFRMYCKDPHKHLQLKRSLNNIGKNELQQDIKTQSISITSENDIVRARMEARKISEALGFNSTDQIKIATVVSELTRNICRYVGSGTVIIQGQQKPYKSIVITAKDNGPGIKNLEEILSGSYTSKTGLGLGLLGCKRIMDKFDVKTSPGEGTTVHASKRLV